MGTVISRNAPAEVSVSGRPRFHRDEIIKACKQFVEQAGDLPIHITELAEGSGISERTLRTVFKEYYGISPIRYIQLRQLNLINQALKKANPENSSVTECLFKHGVWELGRFSKKYHKLFGEYPSQTLRKKTK